ncbi:hypothetical protein FRB90_000845 [Tulasnella sp. 427]|nr:hypothetical protein FRB90_000845 [Tulasnella sp. 427]
MSRLTAPIPSHLRTSTFPLHNQTPTPPESDTGPMDVATAAAAGAPAYSRNPQPLPYDPRQQHVVPATPDRPSSPALSEWATRSLGRRSSTLPYTQTGIKDTVRRRSSKATRWLLMVFPPEVLYNESSTASPSTRISRLASGTLMPLQSNVCRFFLRGPVTKPGLTRTFICQYFAQLTAIAREFGLPSTIGVCMYLQIVDGSQSFAPRMSDESWQILWSPYLSPSDDNPPPSPTHGFPIAGRVEFDIDMSKAKWYTGWMNGTLRHVSHRGESSLDSTGTDMDKTKSVKDQDGAASESTQADNAPQRVRASSAAASGSTTQRAPRRLSLLDRRRTELASISAPSGVPSRLAHYALENGSTSSQVTQDESRLLPKDKKFASHHLSPIPQVDTPPASSLLQKDVNALVHEWRKSSASIPTAVLATSPGQPNTPPAPTEQEEVETSRGTTVAEGLEPRAAIDLADFDWSVSSHGPRTPYTPADSTPLSPRPARSIHLAERTYGSVILTPSTQTSWGPGISPAAFTPVSNASRYPSPDIAARMIEDSPCTPSTATSWGPSSSCWASSPVSQIIRLPSPDIAARMIEDSPCTPSTATTWGPPLSFPPTPAHYNVNGDFYRLPSPDIAERTFDESMPKPGVSKGQASKLGWPFFKPNPASSLAGPFSDVSFASRSLPVSLPRAASAYPIFDLYPPAYPHLEIYPDVAPRITSPVVDKAVIVSLPRPAPSYPDFELYPAGYPNLVIYPDVSSRKLESRVAPKKAVIVSLPRLAPSYPDFDLYPAAYPNLVIYPDVVPVQRAAVSKKGVSLPVSLPRPTACYPDFDLYPAGYPHLEIYPAVIPHVLTFAPLAPSPVIVRLEAPAAVYPEFNIYPAAYPYLVIYPDVVPPQKTEKASGKSACEVSVRLPSTAGYPIFELYPPVYPELVISSPADEGFIRVAVKAMGAQEDPQDATYVQFPSMIEVMLNFSPPDDEWVASQGKIEAATVLPPPPPQPTAPLPAIPSSSAASVGRSRARSGTVSRPLAAPPKSELPPPPPLLQPSLLPSTPDSASKHPGPSVSRSREELHALIFGESDIASAQVTTSPVSETPSPVTAIAISPSAERMSTRRSPSLSPPGGIRVGLPSHPGVTVASNRRSVAERRSTFAPQEPTQSLTRSSTTTRLFPTSPSRSLTVLPETDDLQGLPKSPKSPISRSVSLTRMKTNDDLFKKRQSLLNSRRPSAGDPNPLSVLSEFPSPPGSARSSIIGSPAGPPRPISKLDTSKYPFLR